MINGSGLSHSVADVSLTRRQLVGAALGLSFVASMPALGRHYHQWRVKEEYAAQAALLLDTPVNDFSVSKCSLMDVLEQLASLYNVPVSWIDAEIPSSFTFTLQSGTVREVLDHIVACDRRYCWQQVMGRLVVMPRSFPYATAVTGVRITNMPRLIAADAYMGYLEKHYAGFENMAGSVQIGADIGSLYTAPITLTPDATFIEHFMQLLGSDHSLRFVLSRGIDGLLFCSFS